MNFELLSSQETGGLNNKPAAACCPSSTDGLTIDFAEGRRQYHILNIEKPSPAQLLVLIKATDGQQDRFCLDTVNLCLSRSRRNFLMEAARFFNVAGEIIEKDLQEIMRKAETFVQNHLTLQSDHSQSLTGEERRQAEIFGKRPDLLERILADFERCGLAGECANSLISYLAMTSRKMRQPLSVLVLSSSGAGKSRLLDAVLSFCPPEDRLKVTAFSTKSLFYRTPGSLRHKAVFIEEGHGAEEAAYALRCLISGGELVMESVGRDPLTGKLASTSAHVEGPASVFVTTTDPRVDAETRSRFFILAADESREQTTAILQMQRQAYTLEGCKRNLGAISRSHHLFQRRLRSLPVVNPYAPELSYPEANLQARRDHSKYLNLIAAMALLHQFQRPHKHDPILGEYLEVEPADIQYTNDLMHELVGHTVADLSRPALELMRLVSDFARQEAAASGIDLARFTFTRRQLRENFGWGDTRLRTHLAELVRLEYIIPVRGRMGCQYQYQLAGELGPITENKKYFAGLKNFCSPQPETPPPRPLPAPTPQPPSARRQTPRSPSPSAGCPETPTNPARNQSSAP